MANLRAVTPDEKAPRKRKLTITQAAADGSMREQLVALRERIAVTVEDPNCPPRDLAALSNRLIQITKEIDAIDSREREESDDVATPDAAWEAV
jgi:hypothetical protein